VRLRRPPQKPRDPVERERADFLLEARRHTSYVVADTDFGLFLLPTAERKITRQIFERRRIKDVAVLDRVLELVSVDEDATLVDVGANVGTATVSALVTRRFATAVSIEPDERNFRVLSANVVLNALEGRVTPIRAAVSNHVGEHALALHPHNSGAHELLADGAPLPAGFTEIEQVSTTTLDELVRGGVIDAGRAGLLWVDVQGHEGHVLEGGQTLLSQGTPALVEVFPSALRRAGGPERFLVAAAASFTSFVDIRVALGEREPKPRPVAELSGLIEELGDDRHTDVLLLA